MSWGASVEEVPVVAHADIDNSIIAAPANKRAWRVLFKLLWVFLKLCIDCSFFSPWVNLTLKSATT